MIGLEYFWMSDFFRGVKKIIYIIFILGVRKKIIYIIFIFSGGALGSQKKIIYIIFILRKKIIYIIFLHKKIIEKSLIPGLVRSHEPRFRARAVDPLLPPAPGEGRHLPRHGVDGVELAVGVTGHEQSPANQGKAVPVLFRIRTLPCVPFVVTIRVNCIESGRFSEIWLGFYPK